MPSPPGKLLIVSGPSGVGKSTVLRAFLTRADGGVRLSVSATTRPPRPGERDGVDYHFLTAKEFQRRRKAGDFLESCEVFGSGHWYGTLIEEVVPSLEAGQSVILEIDVEGATQALELFPDAITIFVRPSSLEELERRLRDRGTESEEAVQRRLEVARNELKEGAVYRHQVINDTVEQAVEQIETIVAHATGDPEEDG